MSGGRDATRAHPGACWRGGWTSSLALLLVVCLLGGCQAASPATKDSPPGNATVGSATAPAAPAPTALRPFKVGYAAVSPRVATLWVAADEGFFQRRGLEVEGLSMRNAAALQAALISREIHLSQGGLSATLAARAAGADAVLLGGTLDRALGHLVAQPELRRPDDLRGKRLGVQSIGGTNWTRAMLALEKLGLEPERDGINALVIGDEPTLAQALVAGVVDVTAIGLTASKPMQEQGYATWDLAELGVPEIGQAYVVPASLLQDEPDLVEQFLRATGEAVAYMKGMARDPARRERILTIAGQHLRMPPEETAVELDTYVPLILPNFILSREAMQAVYAITLRDNPELARIPLEAAVDQSLLQRLDREGFFRQLYGGQ